MDTVARGTLKAQVDTTQVEAGCYLNGTTEDGTPVGVATISIAAPNTGPPGNGNGN